MADDIKNFLTDLVSSVQAGKIYPSTHPGFQEYVQKSYQNLKDILGRRPDLTIGIVGGELACGEEIFFDLSQKLKPLLAYLLERGVERIWFNQNVSREELAKFISCLSMPKKQMREEIQDSLLREGIRNIRTGKILAPSAAEARPKAETAEEKEPAAGRESGELSVQDAAGIVENLLKGEKIALLDLKFNVLNLLEHFSGKPHRVAEFVPPERRSLSLVIHLLGTSLLSMSFSSNMGYMQADVADIGIAALLHDIGRIAAGGRPEGETLPDHAVLGALVLLEQSETFGTLPAVVAAEHHRRYDLKDDARPYPVRPHFVSLIVAICNRYEALIRESYESGDFSPVKVYERMKADSGTVFSPELLDDFFRLMGVWPAGTPVVLSDGRIAVVRKPDVRDPFRPRVETVFPGESREWISLADRPADLRIERLLNPFGEGKQYLG
jgi:HD-GYP domain-containing protein (c-di-GMP phosphodiesterase class II)